MGRPLFQMSRLESTPVRLASSASMPTPRAEAAVLLVDFQERLAAAMPPAALAEARRCAAILLAGARVLGVPVVASVQYVKGLGPTVAELATQLRAEDVVEKLEFACTASPAVMERVEALGKKHLVLAGMEAHICVLLTGLGLRARGYEVTLAADAVCSRREEHRALALAEAARAGCRVLPVETVLFSWLERAGTPEFKDVSRLVR